MLLLRSWLILRAFCGGYLMRSTNGNYGSNSFKVRQEATAVARGSQDVLADIARFCKFSFGRNC